MNVKETISAILYSGRYINGVNVEHLTGRKALRDYFEKKHGVKLKVYYGRDERDIGISEGGYVIVTEVPYMVCVDVIVPAGARPLRDFSVCSSQDHFCYRTGLTIALARLEHDINILRATKLTRQWEPREYYGFPGKVDSNLSLFLHGC